MLKASIRSVSPFWLLVILVAGLAGVLREADAATPMNNLRIIRSFAHGVVLQCPTNYYNEHIELTRIRWINERYDYTKPDSNVPITPTNLIASSQISLALTGDYEYISCGYVTNNYLYVRLGFWRLIFIDNPMIDIKVRDNPPLSTYTMLNQTYGSLTVSQTVMSNWSAPQDLLRFQCVNNFDYPVNTKYVWMYLYNPVTCLTETWYRYDIDPNIPTYENQYQVFYNSNKNLKMELSKFLQYLFITQSYVIKFQCASYCDNKNVNSYLFASSFNLTIIAGTINPPNPHPPPPQNTAALVGGILGGLLGFVLLLGLLILLLCCCCGYRKRGLAGTAVVPPTPAVTTIENTHVAAKSSTLIYPVPYHNISSVHLDQMDSCAAGAAAATSGYLKHQIDVPSINVGTDRCYYDPNINTTVRSVASCRSRPEHYLNILTIHRDVSDGECDDAGSMTGSYHHHHHLRQHSSSNLASSHQQGPFEIPIINQNNCVTNSRRYDDDYQQQQQYLHHHHHIRQHSASNINTNNNNDFYLHSYQQQNQEFGQPRYI